MAQQNLGERHEYMVRATPEADFASVARDAGYKYVSRWLADVAYEAAGYPQFKYGPDMKSNEEDEKLTLRISA